jgi:hypothetical protein
MSGSLESINKILDNLQNDEDLLRAAARSAYDQNSNLMTPKELMMFILFGYEEEQPLDDMPEPVILLDNEEGFIEEPHL